MMVSTQFIRVELKVYVVRSSSFRSYQTALFPCYTALEEWCIIGLLNLSVSYWEGHPFLRHANFIFQQNKDENYGDNDTNHKDFIEIESAKHDETAQEKSQNNLMSSFAEKAMSVAGPVVPTKGDGEVDHERSVNVTIVLFLCLYSFPLFLFPVNRCIMFWLFCKQACCSSS